MLLNQIAYKTAYKTTRLQHHPLSSIIRFINGYSKTHDNYIIDNIPTHLLVQIRELKKNEMGIDVKDKIKTPVPADACIALFTLSTRINNDLLLKIKHKIIYVKNHQNMLLNTFFIGRVLRRTTILPAPCAHLNRIIRLPSLPA